MKELSISMFILILIISFSVKDVQAADEGKKVFLNFGNVLASWWEEDYEFLFNPTIGVSANFRLSESFVLSPEIYLLTGGAFLKVDHLWIVPSVLLNYKRKGAFFGGFGLGYFLKVGFEDYPWRGSQEGFFIKLNIGFRWRKISFTWFYAYRLEDFSDARTSVGGTIGFGL